MIMNKFFDSALKVWFVRHQEVFRSFAFFAQKTLRSLRFKSVTAKYPKSKDATFGRYPFFASLFLIALGFISAPAQLNSGAQQNVHGKAGTFAIKNARIITVSGAVIENGTIVIRDGKIAAVGTDVSIPWGAEIIDGRGLSVFPGMIDAGTAMGLNEIPLGAPGTADTTEIGDFNPNAKAVTAVNPYSAHINVTRINGITAVLSMPRNTLIAGQAAVLNLVGATPYEMAVVPQFGLVVSFPRIAQGGGGGGFGGPQVDFNEAVKTRDRRVEELKKYFRDAMDYGKAQDAYGKDATLPRPPVNTKMADMIPYVRGEKPIIFTVERERDIRAVVKFADEMKVKAIIYGGAEAGKAATLLKEKDVAVIFTNIYNLPVLDDSNYDSLFEVPGVLQKAGVRFCISTGDDGPEARDLPYHAGLSSAFGLPPEEALKAVTLYPAQILGVADKMGSIEAGKLANLVVTDGDILEARTNIKYLFINGRNIPLTSRHTELYEQFKDRKLP
jgi:imidazolonepropionase-like amidohydrolase